ncbi:uncharacterized protein LOC121739108 [Aricia agestis]|uniref:uncharacterized protein LOC121739108 n=1 Tax=Aricia agestis TaxID=91739 RepID=UPI001C207E85|nr:uncharacterized protein LOC121739108 [Aricia agestis]
MLVFRITFFVLFKSSLASYNEQYRVPLLSSDRRESYVFNNKEFIIQNLPVSWENAQLLCRGHHNSSLAILDSKEKAGFLAEALSELQFSIDSVWVGARRDSSEDPEGYRWSHGVELRRTAADVLANEDEDGGQRFPLWLNRTHVPVPDAGADCVALERVRHDNPVFLDLPCLIERPFACEREARVERRVAELQSVRCRGGLYRLYDGRLDWHQAAAYCILHGMALANVASTKCLKKLGMSMLKARPSIENAWIGAKGELGVWSWIDSGVNIFTPPALNGVASWPPLREGSTIKQNGCLLLDRHTARSPVFLEARCERRMHFICYQGMSESTTAAPPSDDNYYYVLVRQQFYWQHAHENCLKMNGTLAAIDSNDILIQLLLVMGENKDEPVEHIWISGRLNMTRDAATDEVSYYWYNPTNDKIIPDPKTVNPRTKYMAPWLEEDFTMDNSCLNLDRQDHLNGLVYGLPCDTPQYSICMIEKPPKAQPSEIMA